MSRRKFVCQERSGPLFGLSIRCRALAAILAGIALACPKSGFGDPASPVARVRPVFVDAGNRSAWPKNLEPVPIIELRGLLGESRRGDAERRAARIEEGTYRATFRDGQLCDGRARLVTASRGAAPALIPLGDCNLNLTNLAWIGEIGPAASQQTSEAALAGSDSAGRRVIVAEGGRTHLECDWSAKGQRLLDATEFALVLPPAAVSQIELRLSDEFMLQCRTGVVSTLGRGSKPGETIWQVDLGTHSDCRLAIERKRSAANKPDVFIDQETAYFVGAERTQIELKLQFDVLTAPLSTFSLTVPRRVRIETISYTDDVPLAFVAHSDKETQRIDVALAEPLFGKGRTIFVGASTLSHLNQSWDLPRIVVPGAVRRGGEVQLKIANPLKLTRVGGGMALAMIEARSALADGEESFRFRDSYADRPFTIEVGEPAPSLVGRMLGRLDLRRDRCAYSADVLCTATRGSAFAIECELPDTWDVLEVDPVGESSRTTHWGTRAAGHRTRVKIDFFRALTEREPKRFRLTAVHPVPRAGESIELPILRFPGCESVDAQTVVAHSSAIDLVLDPPGEFAPLDKPAILPPFSDSPLLPDTTASADEKIVVHRPSSPSRQAHITLRRGEEGFTAEVQSTVDIATSQMVERVSANVTPQNGPLDRVFVYLTCDGPPFTWLLLSDRSVPLDATRIPASRHSEWGLPLGGELWDIRLPEPQNARFLLEGARTTTSLGSAGISLAYLPGARRFSGLAQARFEDALKCEVEAAGPKPAALPDPRGSLGRRDEGRVSRAWSYERPTDSLVLKWKESGSQLAVAEFAALVLRSRIDAGGSGDDLHRAQFSVSPRPDSRPFRFRLDGAARVTSASVNGRVVRLRRNGDQITVPALVPDRWNHVEIAYKTSSVPHLFAEKRPIAIPQVEGTLVGFRWQFALAPALQPREPPAGLRLDDSPLLLSWSERLFGPLGRTWSELQLPSLTAVSWLDDLGTSDGAAAERSTTGDPELPGENWTLWHASADHLPKSMKLSLWHVDAMRRLAWIVFLGCLVAGLTLNRLRWRFHRGLVAIAGCAAAAAALVPELYALPLGACVSGILATVALSRLWPPRSGAVASVHATRSHSGSTVSFPSRSILLAVAALGIGSAAFGQSAPSAVSGAGPSGARADASFPLQAAITPAVPEILVVVPVSSAGGPGKPARQPGNDGELVYLQRGDLEMLRKKKQEKHKGRGYVFLSSEYILAADQARRPTIDAHYRVALLSRDAISVSIPLSDVTLAGANACRLNGRSHPLRKSDDGFVLAIDGAEEGLPHVGENPAARGTEAAAPSPHAASPSGQKPMKSVETPAKPLDPHAKAAGPQASSAERPRVFDIALRVFPQGDSGQEAAGFDLSIPRVASTKIQLLEKSLSGPVTVAADGARCRQLRSGDADVIDIGECGHLKFSWGASAAPPPATLTARALQLATVAPNLIEIECRVTYSGSDAAVPELEWRIPAGAAVRSLSENARTALGATTADGRFTRLKFALTGKTDIPLTLAATVLIPVRGHASPLTIPLVQFSGDSPTSMAVRIQASQAGVTSVPGYRVDVTDQTNLWHTPLVDPAFRQEFQRPSEPEFILDVRGLTELPISLVPVVPSNKVRINYEGRFSADRLVWKTTAEIRTENAPAFLHVLRVDPRLKIESISIREDRVERLVRYTRTGNEVTLFLQDRAAATQDLVVIASMPLELGKELSLPAVNVLDATVTDARLLLGASDARVDVAITNDEGAVATEAQPGDAHDESARGARQFRLPASLALPTVRVVLRASAPQVVCATVVRAKKQEMLEVVSYLRIAGIGERREPIEVTIPQEFAPRSTIVANVKKPVERLADGSFGVKLDAAAPNEPILLEVHWTQTPAGENWVVPLLKVGNPAVTEAVLLVSKSVAWEPARSAGLNLSDWPPSEWINRRLPADETFRSWKSADANLAKWVLDRRGEPQARRIPVRTYTRLDLAADAPITGWSCFLLGQFAEPTLSVRWPKSARLEAAFLNGRPIQPISMVEERIAFPVGPESRNRLSILWTDPAARVPSWIGRAVQGIPTPENSPDATGLVAVSAPLDFHLSAPASFHPLERRAFANECDAVLSPDGDATADEVAQWAKARASADFSGSQLQGMMTISPNANAMSIGVYRQTLITAAAAIAIFVVFLAALIWLPATSVARWLAGSEPAWLGSIGLFWWFCLWPRLFGAVLVAAALVWFALRRKARSKRSRDKRLPSTLHVPA